MREPLFSKIVLMGSCLASFVLFTTIIVRSIADHDQKTGHDSLIRTPLKIMLSQPSVPASPRPRISEMELRRIEGIAKDDSLLKNRPGLRDTIAQIETFYKNGIQK